MLNPLLAVKLHIPPALVQGRAVARVRLLEQLDQVRNARLILVSGPAGYGKTTLVSQWVNRTDQRTAWLSLDPSDSEPARFTSYLIAALQTLFPNVGKSAQALLDVGQLPPLESILTLVINDLITVLQPFLLALDDYHVIESPAVHTMLTFLVDHMPSSMCLVMMTRADPPLPLHRWRARNQLAEIRADDLVFNNEEASEFMRYVMSLELSAEQLAMLQARTEGWAAGLQMAALSLRGRSDISAFIESFSGNQQFILDYLTEEVLRRQPESIQTFLLQTCILDRLNGELCNAVLERTSSQTTLEELTKANVFLNPLDDNRQWFRYHSLFRDLLRARLRRDDPKQMPLLHQRAAHWYETHGDLASAIDHAHAAKDTDHLALLVEQASLPLLARGELQTLSTFLGTLSGAAIRTRPALCIVQAWGLALSGQVARVEEWLTQAERALDPNDPQTADLRGQAATIRAQAANQIGDSARAIDMVFLAQSLLPESNSIVRAGAALICGDAHYARNELKEARDWWQQGAQIGQATGNAALATRGTHGIAIVDKMSGQLKRAAEGYRQALELAHQLGGERSPLALRLLLELGELHLQWNELDMARRCARDALANAEWWKNPLGLANGQALFALVALAENNTESAHAALQKADQLISNQAAGPQVHARIQAGRVLLWLVRGDLQSAGRWADGIAEAPADALMSRTQVTQYIDAARVRLAQERPQDARALLEPVDRQTQTCGDVDSRIQALTLQALALAAQSKIAAAAETLECALSLAEPGGYIRTFLDAGEPMRKTLHAWRGGSAAKPAHLRDYADRLLATFSRTGSQDNSLQDALTDREMEVLRLVAQGASNQAIADALVVTTGTVKTHISRIMGKLGAGNRTEAVARAREMRLI